MHSLALPCWLLGWLNYSVIITLSSRKMPPPGTARLALLAWIHSRGSTKAPRTSAHPAGRTAKVEELFVFIYFFCVSVVFTSLELLPFSIRRTWPTPADCGSR